jgi:gentisate 1,2-dioxygenase
MRLMTPATESIGPAKLSNSATLEELYGLLGPLSMGPGWAKPAPALWPSPHKTFRPMLWSYQNAKHALMAAGRLIGTADAERRNLILVNPFQGNTYATTRTLVSAYQMILPGEKARSHRHTPNALRLIVDAEPGAYTVVNGQKLPMMPGDILLTPNWCWHGHGNDGSAPAYWIDFLDVPLVQLLEPMFLENHPEIFEAFALDSKDSPLYFPRAATLESLSNAADSGAQRNVQLQLGENVMETIAVFLLRLEAGSVADSERITANNIYAVVEGSGLTIIDGISFRWERGDVLVAPAWLPHSHQADDQATLLRVTDEPVMSKLGLLRK